MDDTPFTEHQRRLVADGAEEPVLTLASCSPSGCNVLGTSALPMQKPRNEDQMRTIIAVACCTLMLGAVHSAARTDAAGSQATAGTADSAAPITVLSSNGFQAVLEELAPQFERVKHRKVTVIYDLASTLKQKIEGGQPFDLAILTPAAIDDLIKTGKVAYSSRTTLARAGLGLAVRAGAHKPNIATNESFKRALVDAKSIAYVKEGASGMAFAALIERIGIAETLKVKSRLTATRDEVGDALRSGEAEVGVLPISEILPMRGVELAAPFPPDLQTYIVMVAGVSAKSGQASAVRELIDFLTAPTALPTITAKGMERM
jgi:molybdate transport system substrate-binding protein